MFWVLHACFLFKILTATMILILISCCSRAVCSVSSFTKGNESFCFISLISHNIQKAQSHGQERAFGADIVGIPFLLNRVGHMAISQSPVITALPQKSDKKNSFVCYQPFEQSVKHRADI